jgi:cell division initiation protein
MHNDDEVVEIDEGRRIGVERSLTVTPIDLRQRKFTAAMRGFDRQEVTSFLAEASVDFENTLRENDRLRQEVVRLKGLLAQFRELEGSLKSMLMSAQKVADDIHENATQESKRIVGAAEARAELAMQKAQTLVEAAQRDIDNLKLKRREVETSLEATISTLKTSLEFVRDQERRDRDTRDSNVVPHRPHVVHSA